MSSKENIGIVFLTCWSLVSSYFVLFTVFEESYESRGAVSCV